MLERTDMRVLVSGGSGVIGAGLIPELLAAGHQVRMLSRHAEAASRQWPAGVDPFEADVASRNQLRGAATGCDAVVHISGIITEVLPDITFENVNVGGTKNMLIEASRAGCPKFVFISSLGAERGESAYHKSKYAGEYLVGRYAGSWTIVRPGNVYGPGDEVMSELLKLQRTMPAIPMIGDGTQPFQPIWYEDLGKALRRAVEDHQLHGIYEVAGEEVTCANDLLDRLEKLTGRIPLRLRIPEFLAGFTVRAAQGLGVPFPINESQYQMILEQNVIEPAGKNALGRVFEVEATTLQNGLKMLADAQLEQEPGEGVGNLERKRFRAEIRGSRMSAESLMTQVRQRCTDLMPIEFDTEPGASQDVVKGTSLTAALPLRGNIQIRVEEVTPCSVTFATLRGHPLAGVVRFSSRETSRGSLEFEVTIFARAATMLDWVAMKGGGQVAQNWTWRTVVERVVEISGGSSEEVQEELGVVPEGEVERVEEWIREMVATRKHDKRKDAQEWKEMEVEVQGQGQR